MSSLRGLGNNCYLKFASSLVLWLWLQPCYASIVVYIISPDGIVIGADGLGVELMPCGYIGPRQRAPFSKIFLLKGKLVIANVGLGGLKSPDQRTMLYSLPAFIEFIDYNFGSDMTVTSLSRVVENEAPKVLSFLPDRLTLPDYSCELGENQPFNRRSPFFHEFIIAGYESGVPLIYYVHLKIDWDHHRIIANRFPKEQPQRQNIQFSVYGSTNALVPLALVCSVQAQINSYEIAFSRFPVQQAFFCTRDFSGYSLELASDMVRILLEICTEVEPSTIGFPLTVVTIPRVGSAQIRSYCDPFPSAPSRLTKQHGCKHN
jgi:hypothetical protein